MAISSNPYIVPLIKWWRLIVLVTLLAAATSTVSAMFQPDIYESKTTLVVGTTYLNPNPDSGQIYIAEQLAQIYADMASREPIQNATMAALGINFLPAYRSRVIPNTQMVEISVTDTNPKRAQIIANELATQLKLQSPTLSKTEAANSQDFITAQLSGLQNQILLTENNVEELQKSMVNLNSASQIANIQKEISQQTDKLSSLRANYASFLANSQGGAVNILSVLEPANFPSGTVGTSKFTIVVLAGLVGFSLGIGAAYLIEFLDKTIKSTSDIERIFNLPVIGYVSEISNEGTKPVSFAKNPDSILAENFRLLRSNIQFYRVNNLIKTIMITSPGQGTGKTTVASNLALSISQEEGNVVLVDADLRRPAVHAHWGMAKKSGLAEVLTNQADIQSVVKQWSGEGSLGVITAGSNPSRIVEIPGPKGMSAILEKLEEKYGLVIVDSPPLILADSYNLASAVDGVILVIEPGKTSEEQARTIKDQLGRANAKMLGVVFNKVSEESANSYYDYQYRSLYSPKYYADYTSMEVKEPISASRSKALLEFFERGKVPSEFLADVENAITAIKARTRNILHPVRKSRKNGKS